MNKFTSTEIDLCRQVAEYFHKPIEYGDWYSWNREVTLALFNSDLGEKQLWKGQPRIPLWSLSDCLLWLEEKGYRYILHFYDKREFHFSYGRDDTGQWSDVDVSDTPLKACLRAVLSILKEGK